MTDGSTIKHPNASHIVVDRISRYKITLPNKSIASHKSPHASHPDEATRDCLKSHVGLSSQIKADQTGVRLAEKNKKSLSGPCARSGGTTTFNLLAPIESQREDRRKRAAAS